jgi:transcriptional regulator with XRE-family HTH domain
LHPYIEIVTLWRRRIASMKVPLAARLRKVRRDQDHTQQELGALAKINYTTISRIESGEAKQVYADTVMELAKALDVSADYLLGLTDDLRPLRRPRTKPGTVNSDPAGKDPTHA